MDSSNGVASRTRSRRSSGFSEQYGLKYLTESSGKSNEHESDQKDRKGKNISRSIERESRKKRKTKHDRIGFEIDDEGIEIINEAEFRNTSGSNHAEGIEIESISKEEFLNCKRNHRTEGIKVEIIDEDEFEHDHEEGVEIESSDEAGIEFEIIGESEFVSSRRRSNHAEEIEVEESCPKEKENEMRSEGSGHEPALCIASRTRSKRDVANKPLQVDNFVSDSSDGSLHSSDSNPADSWSSFSESDDEDDEDFIVENSGCSHSMELSGSYVEEDNDHKKMKARGMNKLSDSDDDEECSRISLDASSKVGEDKAEAEVQNHRDNNRKRVADVDDCPNVQEGNGVGSEGEDLVRSSLGSNHTPRNEHARNEEIIDVFKKNERSTRSHLCPRQDNDVCGKKKKSRETNDKLARENENAEDVDRTKFDSHDRGQRKEHARNDEVINMFGKNEWPTRTFSCPQKDDDFCKNLLDAVLDERAEFGDDKHHDEVKKSTEYGRTLPLRFRFEDEDTRPVEKSELDVLIGSLFDELDLCLKYGDVNISGYQEVEKDNANHPDAETNQYALCCKGKHYLIHDDELGLICSYCLHVELEAKHIIPLWAERMYRGSDRRLSGDEQAPVLDGDNLEQDENFTGCCDPSKGTIWGIKPGIRETMYEHQREGLEFMWKNLAGTTYLNELETTDSSNIGGCIISHAPGTGKTRLTIVFIEMYLKLFPNCRPLIIAPASMLLTWEEEFRKWEVQFPFHNLNNLEMSGKENKVVLNNLQEGKSLNKDTARMIKIYSWNKEKSILGMSYRLFELLAGKKSKSKPLKKILLEKTGLVVLDEGHTPRSRKSNIWNTLLELKTKKRIILSGTPFQNNFEELFNILRIVRPALAGVLAKERIFAEMMTIHLRKKYMNDDERHQETTNHAIEELKAAMAPFVHVHKGTILQQSLPGLRDCVILLKPPPLQKSLIERIEGSQSSFKFDHKVALISVHPYLFKHCLWTENERKGVDLAMLECTKLNPVEGVKTRCIMELIRLSAVRNEKVLIFSQYIKPLALIQNHLKKIFNWTKGKHILKMEGKMGQKKRQDLIKAFNDPKSEAKVLLASTKCCSEGINLVGASRVILLDVVWNPSVERQAISRAYRLGQKKIVYTYHLMTSGTTEGDKYCRQAEKERLSELVFTSSSNEKCRVKNSDVVIEDEVLEEMVENGSLKDMFEKIIYQPKEKNLMDTFSIAG
ncbi:DNA repair protein, SNF2 family [Handroanthus impetiginosus]|uniref:DNA repair protein, SNF2 family n=1 Tax=Handroanthus impetiginosus TaxID=429701 RepID=A0A2G9HFM7_9LAMI|nr:DNA repair protein, SNF2 family [Handroanthus impetiginosus]